MTDAIRRELDSRLRLHAGRAGGALAAPVRYALPGGKRVRGMLLVLVGGQCRTEEDRLADAGACLELLHAATLVQDDIFDRSRTRRGRPAVHCVFGPRLATLASDWMLAEAMRAAYRLHPAYGEALSGCAQAMIGGEAREFISPSPMTAASLRAKAVAIARGKTGELFGLALSAGALLEASPSRAARFHQIGCDLGIAFQYLDDALDLYGEGLGAGKDLRQDAAARLWTMPMLDAWAMAGQQPGALLPEKTASLIYTAPAKTFVLGKARAQWQTALHTVLEELPIDCGAGALLRSLRGTMLAPTEIPKTRSAA